MFDVEDVRGKGVIEKQRSLDIRQQNQKNVKLDSIEIKIILLNNFSRWF